MLTRKQVIEDSVVIVTVAVLSFFAGASLVRPKVKTETKNDTKIEVRTVEVEKRVEGPVRIVERTVETPGQAGPVIERVRVEERAPVTVETNTNKEVLTRVVEVQKTAPVLPDWHLSLRAGWSEVAPRPNDYGITLERRIIGTFKLGVWTQHRLGEGWAGGISAGLSW